MVFGLPSWGDTPVDPHSAFTHLKNYPINGGLVDGPVYTSIYKNLIGITLNDTDEYAPFQSDLAVYHDDYGDYSTNEPTMDGTASLIYLLAAKQGETRNKFKVEHGAITRGDSKEKNIALVFTGDEYFEGLPAITNTLKQHGIKAGFFLTGRLYENNKARSSIRKLIADGHYLGPHSDRHLLYNDWDNRDRLLVTKDSLIRDLDNNYRKMAGLGIKHDQKFFIPPYEWWNNTVVTWCNEKGIQVISFTSGIPTQADYTYPEMGKTYKSSDTILTKLFEKEYDTGINGAIILVHIGTDPGRKDKLYDRLPELIDKLKARGYQFTRIDAMLE